MFSTHIIKDSRRGINKHTPPTEAELFDERPDERTLPYFSIVPEQVMSDERYLNLNLTHQMQFWIFVIHVLWREGARCARHPGIIAMRIGIGVKEWESLEKKLLENQLLCPSPDGYYLIQPELRTQYLITLETNNKKRRGKDK